MFEEDSSDNKKKRILTVGVISIVLIIVLLLIKTFIFQPEPSELEEIYPSSQEEVVIKYFKAEQGSKRKEAEKYLASELSTVEILREKYKTTLPYWIQQDEKEGSAPTYEVKDSQVQENETTIIIEATMNKMADSLFFDFVLPEKLAFHITLKKEQDQWKITMIDSPDLVLDSKLEEKVETVDNMFIKPIVVRDYSTQKTEPPQKSKFVLLEVEYENRSSEQSSYFYSFGEWSIVSTDQKSYHTITDPNVEDMEPTFPSPKLGSGEIKKVNVFFSVNKETPLKELIFRNLDKKVIFSID